MNGIVFGSGDDKDFKAQFLFMEENMLFAGKCTNLVWFKGDCEGGSVGVESRTADRQWRT